MFKVNTKPDTNSTITTTTKKSSNRNPRTSTGNRNAQTRIQSENRLFPFLIKLWKNSQFYNYISNIIILFCIKMDTLLHNGHSLIFQYIVCPLKNIFRTFFCWVNPNSTRKKTQNSTRNGLEFEKFIANPIRSEKFSVNPTGVGFL